MNILVLNSSERCFATQSIIQAGEKHRHRMVVLDPAFFSPLVSNVEAGYDRVYDLLQKTATRITINDVDAIIPRIGNNLIYNSYILEHLTLNLGIYSIQSASGLRASANKFHTLQMVSRHGVKTPITLYVKATKNIDFLIEKVGGLPFVLKYNYGSQGAGVILMETKKSAISTIEGLLKNKADFILQQYIESRGQDIRAIVMGDHVIVAYQRTAPKGDFRSNLSLGGSGKLINLSMDDQIMCVKASKAIGMEVSGVDLIKDTKGTTYLNEINSNFGFKGQKITGTNIGEHLISYIEKREISGNTAPAKTPDVYYDQLRGQNKMLWEQLQFFTGNQRIQQLFDQSNGKEISYKDLNGKINLRKIKNKYDIYRLIFDTFNIK
jgi:ribosomal protein S6--L-glutamate ligase